MNGSLDEEITFDAAFDDISGLAAAKVSLAWTMNAVQPGLPVLYYGDEWLTRGANDPYNRAPFPDSTSATEQQRSHFETVKRWNAYRSTSKALRFGTLKPIDASTHYIALERTTEDETLYYVLSKGDTEQRISLPCSAQPVLSEPVEADLVQLDPLTWSVEVRKARSEPDVSEPSASISDQPASSGSRNKKSDQPGVSGPANPGSRIRFSARAGIVANMATTIDRHRKRVRRL